MTTRPWLASSALRVRYSASRLHRASARRESVSGRPLPGSAAAPAIRATSARSRRSLSRAPSRRACRRGRPGWWAARVTRTNPEGQGCRRRGRRRQYADQGGFDALGVGQYCAELLHVAVTSRLRARPPQSRESAADPERARRQDQRRHGLLVADQAARPTTRHRGPPKTIHSPHRGARGCIPFGPRPPPPLGSAGGLPR